MGHENQHGAATGQHPVEPNGEEGAADNLEEGQVYQPRLLSSRAITMAPTNAMSRTRDAISKGSAQSVKSDRPRSVKATRVRSSASGRFTRKAKVSRPKKSNAATAAIGHWALSVIRGNSRERVSMMAKQKHDDNRAAVNEYLHQRQEFRQQQHVQPRDSQ